MELYTINLQLFANSNTNTTLDSGLSVENKTFYDKVLIREAQANLVHDQFGQKRNIPKNGGKTIEFRQIAALPKATQPLTEGVTPDGSKIDMTNIEATVSQYGNYVEISDVLDLTAIDPMMVETVEIIGRQAGLTLDTITRNILQSGTNVYYCPKEDGTKVTSRATLDSTCKLTVDVVRRVAAQLKACNAPKIDGSYVAIIHPFAAYDLMHDDLFTDITRYGAAERLYEGEIGKVAGVRFIESSEAYIAEGGVFCTLFMGANAYGTTEVDGGGLKTIIKQLGSGGTADPLDQRATVGWKAMKTAEILIPHYLVRVESKSAFSDEAKAN